MTNFPIWLVVIYFKTALQRETNKNLIFSPSVLDAKLLLQYTCLRFRWKFCFVKYKDWFPCCSLYLDSHFKLFCMATAIWSTPCTFFKPFTTNKQIKSVVMQRKLLWDELLHTIAQCVPICGNSNLIYILYIGNIHVAPSPAVWHCWVQHHTTLFYIIWKLDLRLIHG